MLQSSIKDKDMSIDFLHFPQHAMENICIFLDDQSLMRLREVIELKLFAYPVILLERSASWRSLL